MSAVAFQINNRPKLQWRVHGADLMPSCSQSLVSHCNPP